MRRRRLCIAAVVMWSLAFAQAAVAAHACSMLATLPASPAPAMESNAQPMQPGCEGMAKQSDATLNVCESHCFAGQQVYGQADVPSASIAPQLALTVRVTECVPAYFTASSLAPLAAAPPPLLRFNRFLI